MAKSELKYREYEKKNTDFSALKNIQDNIDAILNINIRMTNFVALKDETVKFVNDSRINYYNVTQMVKILSDYSYFFSDSMVYMFYPEKDIYIGRDSTYYIINYSNPYTAFEHNKYYAISAYELDENGRSKISVYFASDKKSENPESNGVVSKVTTGINSDNDIFSMVTVCNINGEYNVYYATEDTEQTAKMLEQGDIISYTAKGENLYRLDINYDLSEDKLYADAAASYNDLSIGYLYSVGDGIMYTLKKDALYKTNISFNDIELHDVTQQSILFIDVIGSGNTVKAILRYKPISEAKTYFNSGTAADYAVMLSRYSENTNVYIYNY